MIKYISTIGIVLALGLAYYIGYYTGHEIGYQKASARIYQSINMRTYQSWIADMVRYQVDETLMNAPAVGP